MFRMVSIRLYCLDLDLCDRDAAETTFRTGAAILHCSYLLCSLSSYFSDHGVAYNRWTVARINRDSVGGDSTANVHDRWICSDEYGLPVQAEFYICGARDLDSLA